MVYNKFEMMLSQKLILIGLVILSLSCQSDSKKADLIIHNAVIWTGVENEDYKRSIAITDEKIIATGTDDELTHLKDDNTTLIDAKGNFIVPGFIDSHVHLMAGGRSLLSVDLRNASSPEEFKHKVAGFAESLKEGEWILEGNWDHTLWGGELPHKDWIDEVTENIPVFLFRLDGHMALANTAALKFAGVDNDIPDVDGGTIIKDDLGNLTGLLKDNAMNLVIDKIPPMTSEQKRETFEAASEYFISNGVTSVHDVDGLNGDLESYSTALELLKENKLKTRIYASAPLNQWAQTTISNHLNWVKTGSLKGFVDGSLGSHTAVFHDHYLDIQDDKGFFINKEDELYEWISEADKANLHVLVHAIGVSAIHTLMNIYEKVAKENGKKIAVLELNTLSILLLKTSLDLQN
tara:strand:- start:862 stop:2082 length:1221 start_codon:yes stop_codon:yes gene_type:complete